MTFLSGSSLSFFSPSMPPQFGPDVMIVCRGAPCRMAAARRALSAFHSLLPAVEDRLVDRFQDGQARGRNGKAARPASPRSGQTPPATSGRVRTAVFVVDVDDDQQSGAVEPLDGGFQLLATLLDDLARGRVHDHSRGDAQADMLEPDVGHVVRFGRGNVVGEMLRRVVPGKTEPLADVGTRCQAIRAAAGNLARAFGGGKRGCDRHAAGGNAGQSQEITAGKRGRGGHRCVLRVLGTGQRTVQQGTVLALVPYPHVVAHGPTSLGVPEMLQHRRLRRVSRQRRERALAVVVVLAVEVGDRLALHVRLPDENEDLQRGSGGTGRGRRGERRYAGEQEQGAKSLCPWNGPVVDLRVPPS